MATAEMLHHIMKAVKQPQAIDEGTLTLRAEDDTSAGDNLTFLKSQLTWDVGEDGKERVLDADGNGCVEISGLSLTAES
jgi:protein arginine N-methyltransferase 2